MEVDITLFIKENEAVKNSNKHSSSCSKDEKKKIKILCSYLNQYQKTLITLPQVNKLEERKTHLT